LVEILAMIMFGEAGVMESPSAAMAIGHVYLNRINQWGLSPEEAAQGFFAFPMIKLEDVPIWYFPLANAVLYSGNDPTHGCLYIFSWHDTNNMYDIFAPLVRKDAAWSEWDGVYGLYAYKDIPVIDIFSRDVVEYMRAVVSMLDLVSAIPQSCVMCRNQP